MASLYASITSRKGNTWTGCLLLLSTFIFHSSANKAIATHSKESNRHCINLSSALQLFIFLVGFMLTAMVFNAQSRLKAPCPFVVYMKGKICHHRVQVTLAIDHVGILSAERCVSHFTTWCLTCRFIQSIDMSRMSLCNMLRMQNKMF